MAILAYVTDWTGDDLVIVNVSNPAAPTELSRIGSTWPWGPPNFLYEPDGIEVVGDYAYVCTRGDGGLTVIDVSDPTNPTYAGGLYGDHAPNWLQGARSVDIVGNRAYVVALAHESLVIIDITNPLAPSLLGNVRGDGAPNFLEMPRDVQVVGNYAFVAVYNFDNVLNVIDVSNPAAPFSAARTAAEPMHLHIVGNYAYLAEWAPNRLSIYDISNPLIPTFRGSIAGTGAPPWLGRVTEVQVVGDYAYCGSDTDRCMTVIHIADPTNPTWVASIHHLDVPGCVLNGPRGIKILGNYAYVCNIGPTSRLTIIDISDPTNPTWVSSTYMGAGIGELSVRSGVLAPSVTTNPVTGRGMIIASINGLLNDDGGEPCECGFEWGADITYGATTSTESKVTGEAFSQRILGLFPGTEYHYRAFTRNSVGTSYGDDESFRSEPSFSRAYALAREEL